MDDRAIANSILENYKHQVEDLTKAAMESSGNLRQTLLQMRNQCEQDQSALGQYAIYHQWYLPAAPANPSEINSVASFFKSSGEPVLRQ